MAKIEITIDSTRWGFKRITRRTARAILFMLQEYQYKDKVLEQEQKTEYWATLEEWKNDFKGFINELSMPKDDYKGIMEYIDEIPNYEPQESKEV